MGTFRQQMITIATVLAIFAAEPSVSRSVNISSSWLLPQNEFPVFYRHFRDRVTWFEADAVCQFHHAQLATVESNSQFEAIRSYLKELDVIDNVWIGLKRNSEASEFTWTNYQPLARSGYFREEVPRSSDPVCVVTDPTANFKWHSLHCGGPEVASFVCELPVPYWASKSNGCMTSMMEGMTVTFLPERPAIQLTKECGPGVSKNVTCKGNMKQSDILEKLSCPNSNKLQTKYQLKPTKPILPDMYKTTTSSSESDVEDYAIEMATITQYNDETFQSISKVMGRSGNNGGMINLPQEMSIALEPIKSTGRGGFDTNGIDSAFIGAAVETTSSTTTSAPSSTTKAPTTTEKITFWPTAKTTRTAATFSATTSTTAAAASTAGVTTTSTTTTTATAPITTRRPVPSTTVSGTSSTSTTAAAAATAAATSTSTTTTITPVATSSTGTKATVTTMRATTEKPTTAANRIVPTAARPPSVNRPAAAYEFGTPVATAAQSTGPATVTLEPMAITSSPTDTTQSTTFGKINAVVTPFGAAPIRVYKKIDLPSSLRLPAAVNFDDDDDDADEDDSPYRPIGRANGTLAVTTASAVAAGKKTNGTTVVTGRTTTTTERAMRPTTTAIPPKKTVVTTTSTEAVTATVTAAVVTESASPNAPNVSADSLDDNNWNPPTAASTSSAAPQTVTVSGAAGTPVAVDVTAAAAAISDTVTNSVTTTNAAATATATASTSTTVTAASTAAATVNNRRKVNNYDAYTEHPNRNRHIVRPKQQHHHSYPYILYRLLG